MPVTTIIKSVITKIIFSKIGFSVIGVAAVGLVMTALLFAYNKGKSDCELDAELAFAREITEYAITAEQVRKTDLNILQRRWERRFELEQSSEEVDVTVSPVDCRDLGLEWLREYNKAIDLARDPRESID